jgi:hypothetical protein
VDLLKQWSVSSFVTQAGGSSSSEIEEPVVIQVTIVAVGFGGW